MKTGLKLLTEMWKFEITCIKIMSWEQENL